MPDPNAISLCMIVKNEQAYLHRCLSSIKPIVDEIIIVDTGSSDRTRQIAEAFGACVFDFAWCNDFAAARNFGLARASGQWIFVLDADEVLSTRDHGAIASIINSTPNQAAAYTFVTRNYTFDSHQVGWIANRNEYPSEEAGSGWIPTDKVRLFPRHRDIVFTYPVHEVVEPTLMQLGLPILSCPVPIHHYGPLNKKSLNTKNKIYYQIGLNKLSAGTENPVAVYELAIQAGNLGRFDDAIALWRQSIALQPDRPESYVHLSTAYFKQGEYELGKRAAREALKRVPGMKEALYNLSLCNLCTGDFVSARQTLVELTQIHPRFQPAEILYAVVQGCIAESNCGAHALAGLLHSMAVPDLAATLKDLTQRLKDAGQDAAACRLLEASAEAGI